MMDWLKHVDDVGVVVALIGLGVPAACDLYLRTMLRRGPAADLLSPELQRYFEGLQHKWRQHGQLQ